MFPMIQIQKIINFYQQPQSAQTLANKMQKLTLPQASNPSKPFTSHSSKQKQNYKSHVLSMKLPNTNKRVCVQYDFNDGSRFKDDQSESQKENKDDKQKQRLKQNQSSIQLRIKNNNLNVQKGHKKNLSLQNTKFRKNSIQNQKLNRLSKYSSMDKRFRQKQGQKRAQSIRDKYRIRQSQCLNKMEKSIARFTQSQFYLRKVELMKKKKKKTFSIQSCHQHQPYFKIPETLADPHPQLQSHSCSPLIQYPLQTLPNICYDSQFSYQREGPCLTMLNNKLFLFGGAIRRKLHSLPLGREYMNVDALFHWYDDDRWVRQPIAGQLGWDRKNLVYHTVSVVGRKLVVVVGGLLGDTHKTLSKFNRYILIYNPDTKKLLQHPINFSIRSHTAISFDNYLILHGGITQQSSPSNNMQIFIITPSTPPTSHPSSSPSIQSHGYTVRNFRIQTNQYLAHHQMVSTLAEDRIFRSGLGGNNGLYVFGGEDRQGDMSQGLKICRIGCVGDLERKSLKSFQLVNTYGQGPCGRKNHSMNLVTSKNALVIIGGTDKNTTPLSDIWLLDLTTHKWCQILTDPSIDILFGSMYKHSAVSNSNSIYVFGGRQEKNMGSQNFWRIQFSANGASSSYNQVRSEDNRQKRLSQVSKISSIWSLGGTSSNQFPTLDRIAF